MSDVSRLLDAAAAGGRPAAAELLPLVYDELRKLAAARMAAERPDHSLDATGLVHEAYLRLVGDQQFDGRGHFFAAAAEAMRRILVESARSRGRLKRGGDRVRLELLDRAGSLEQDPDLLFGSFWAVTEWWRAFFFDPRVVPVLLVAVRLAAAACGCGPVTYGEVRRRELFHAMLLAWTFGLALLWRWWARARSGPPG